MPNIPRVRPQEPPPILKALPTLVPVPSFDRCALERDECLEALWEVQELRSTCEVARTAAALLGGSESPQNWQAHLRGPVGDEMVAQLALQAEQQRAIDATERDLSEVGRDPAELRPASKIGRASCRERV